MWQLDYIEQLNLHHTVQNQETTIKASHWSKTGLLWSRYQVVVVNHFFSRIVCPLLRRAGTPRSTTFGDCLTCFSPPGTSVSRSKPKANLREDKKYRWELVWPTVSAREICIFVVYIERTMIGLVIQRVFIHPSLDFRKVVNRRSVSYLPVSSGENWLKW